MTGTLIRGTDPKGPELYVDTELATYPVVVTNPQELELLRLWVGRRVKLTPKVMGTRTSSEGRIEAIVFATNVRSTDVN